MAVARDGERATPPVPAPGPLRRYLSFARLPDPALEVARRVLDEDEGFRTRVAGIVDQAQVGRAGWLFLTRPDGWRDEVEQLRKAAAAEEVAAKEERSEREAQRRLAGAEAAAARAEAARVSAAAESDRLRAALDAERRAASGAVGEVDRLREELARLVEERAAAIRRVKDLEAQLADRTGELRTMRHELRMAQAELAESLAGEAPAPAAGPAPPVVVPGDAVEGAPPAPGLDQALDRRALAEAVAAASALVEPVPEPEPPRVPAGGEPRPASRRRPPARRRPVPLPPGILDDGPAAAEHLVRQPGALVLVDGYNVSQAQWHGVAPAEQRRRLLDACAELHARCGADVEVVFDGSGEQPTAGALVRASVRYRFTPAGVEADDALLDRLDEEPAARPVVVASSDRRVAEGARLRGANVVGARQFLAALRR